MSPLKFRREAPIITPENSIEVTSLQKPFLSLSMIVKDEAERLATCLASARALCDELVVVDTGSTDQTVEIAQAHGARVFHFQWADDFAAARNFALEQTRGDWVLHLDADEVAIESSSGALRAELAAQPGGVNFLSVPVRCPWPNGIGLDEVSARRLFRRNPDVRWRRRIHENITNLAGETPAQQGISSALVVDHSGYIDVEARRAAGKNDRNIRLLAREILDNPDDGVLHFYLAREYASIQEHPQAIQICRNALQRGAGLFAPEFDWAVRCVLMRSAATLGDHATVLEVGAAAEASCGSSELINLMASSYAAHGDLEAAERYFERALTFGARKTSFQVTDGTGTWQPAIGLGSVAWQAGDRDRAIARWRTVAASNPNVAAAHLALGKGLLGTGQFAEAIAPLRRAVELEPRLHEAKGHLSNAEFETGMHQAAYERLEQLVQEHPEVADHWHWLGSLLLRLDEADAAAELLGLAIAQHQDNAGIYLLLGTALQKLERHEDALHAFALASAIDPALEVARAGIMVSAYNRAQVAAGA